MRESKYRFYIVCMPRMYVPDGSMLTSASQVVQLLILYIAPTWINKQVELSSIATLSLDNMNSVFGF